MKRDAHRIHRSLTEMERARVDASRQWALDNEKEIRQLAKFYRDHPNGSFSTLNEVLELLKAERLRQQLSFSDVHGRTGIERPNVSRLEKEAESNPTISTLMRYAEALGKQLLIALDDLPAGSSSVQD